MILPQPLMARGWASLALSLARARLEHQPLRIPLGGGVVVQQRGRLGRRGLVDAEHLAERLTLRDRQADDRRLCLECRELEASGRCAAERRGTLSSANRRLEPKPIVLMRCPSFSGNPHHR